MKNERLEQNIMKNRTSLKERKKLAGQLDVSGQLALRHREISIGLAIFGTISWRGIATIVIYHNG